MADDDNDDDAIADVHLRMRAEASTTGLAGWALMSLFVGALAWGAAYVVLWMLLGAVGVSEATWIRDIPAALVGVAVAGFVGFKQLESNPYLMKHVLWMGGLVLVVGLLLYACGIR